MPRLLIILLVLYCSAELSFSQGESALPFLLIEPTTRATGMAGAFTAIANDAGAMYFNPAGMTQMQWGSVDFNQVDWLPSFGFSDLDLTYRALTWTITQVGSFGISYTRLNLGKNIITDETGAELASFDTYEQAFAFGYARELNKNISLGATVKMIESHLINSVVFSPRKTTVKAYALDIGFLYQNFLPDFCYRKRFYSSLSKPWLQRPLPPGPAIGIAIQNIGPHVEYRDQNQGDPLPQNLRLGLAWQIVDTDIAGIRISADIQKLLVKKYKDGSSDAFYNAWFTSWSKFQWKSLRLGLGVEIFFTPLFTLRFGRFIEDEDYGARKYTALGFSLGPESLRFNYSEYIPKERDHPLRGTRFFGFSFAY